MFQVIDRQSLKFNVSTAEFDTYKLIEAKKEEIFFLHPIISIFFDKLTMNQFIHKEILLPENLEFNVPSIYTINFLSTGEYKVLKAHYLQFQIETSGAHLKFRCVNPEFGIYWILKDLNSQSLCLALGLLEWCDLLLFEQIGRNLKRSRLFQFLKTIGAHPLNRYDLLWDAIKKFGYEKELSDFPLYLDQNIRSERRYDKIL